MTNDSDISPVSIQRRGEHEIQITWSDGAVSSWTSEQLRTACPCASCREKRRGDELDLEVTKPKTLPVLSATETQPVRIESMTPVGNYAYNIAFSDGHSSGVFLFHVLRNSPSA